MKFYLMDRAYFRQLKADSKEILAYAATLGGLAERRAARREFLDELAASGKANLAPVQGKSQPTLYTVADGVASIPIVGQLTPVAEQDICGGYSASAVTEYGFIVAATQAANADPSVESIDYHVDSPGGYINGVEEAAQAMAASAKPTRAIVGGMAASAAYWLASQADSIVAASPVSRVGSIGVIVEGYNDDRALAAEGIDHVVITSSGAPDKYADTATDEGKAMIRADLDKLEGVFVQRVAEGRGVTTDKVRADFGKGGVLIASEALAAGMIDGVNATTITRRVQENAPSAQLKPAAVQAQATTGPRPAISDPKGGSKIMNLDQLKAESPEVYAQALALGVQAERDRVAKINAFAANGPAAAKAAAEAITAGKSFDEVMPELVAASARVTQENAPILGTKTVTSPSGGALDDIDAQAAAMFGYTPEDARRYGQKKEA